MRKKILSIILSLAVAVTMIPAMGMTTFASEKSIQKVGLAYDEFNFEDPSFSNIKPCSDAGVESMPVMMELFDKNGEFKYMFMTEGGESAWIKCADGKLDFMNAKPTADELNPIKYAAEIIEYKTEEGYAFDENVVVGNLKRITQDKYDLVKLFENIINEGIIAKLDTNNIKNYEGYVREELKNNSQSEGSEEINLNVRAPRMFAQIVFEKSHKSPVNPVELLKAKTSGKKAVKLSWTAVPGATKYVVYGQKCGKSFKKLKTTTRTSYTVKKIKGKKLKAHKSYKFCVAAYTPNGIVKSKSIHFITGKTQGKYANAKSISVKPASVTRKPGETAILIAKTEIYKNRKHVNGTHGVDIRYISDNPAVATVNKYGQVKAIAAGTATIYVQDVGGLWTTSKITVTNTEKPAPPAPVETKTIGELLATAGEEINYWYNEKNSYGQVEDDGYMRFSYYDSIEEKMKNEEVKLSETAIKDGDNYIYASGEITLTFAMLEGVLNSMTLSGSSISEMNGMYVGGTCFPAGTQVQCDLEGNTKNIEDFKAGDNIVSYNVNTGEYYLAKVRCVFVHDGDQQVTKLADVTLKNGAIITMTVNHPVFTDEGFKSINGESPLTAEDKVLVDGKWMNITDIQIHSCEPTTTYNLNVMDFDEIVDDDTLDTYIAGGIVVHNVK